MERPLLIDLFAGCFGWSAGWLEMGGRVVGFDLEFGRSRWSYGSYHLWGDVPALMPMTKPRAKVGGFAWYPPDDPRHVKGLGFNTIADRQGREMADDSVKVGGSAGDDWFTHHNRREFEDRATKNSGGS